MSPFMDVEKEDEQHTPRLEPHDNTDSEDDAYQTQAPKTTEEKRRAQNALFQDFIASKGDAIAKQKAANVAQHGDNEVLTIKELMKKQESNVRINNAREYQTELFDRAKQQNVIAVLDTGSGKTHIAVLLLRHVLDQELEHRAARKNHRVAFFLTDSVTLVFQQANVLKCNLDHEVAAFCGAMNTDLWNRDVWKKHLSENMVIVCTAEVLNQCLTHSFTRMADINLLIFDEAHHAKKNHPYAEIIRNFYLEEKDQAKRPKIFGMTASPVDAKVDVHKAATELEWLLQSCICTASDLDLVRHSVSRPDEKVASYSTLCEPFETSLHQQLKRQYGNMGVLEKLFAASKRASSELGRWCSDMYWSFALTGAETEKKAWKLQQRFHAVKDGKPMDQLDKEVARLSEAQEAIKRHDFGIPRASHDDLSSKVLVLSEWLQTYFGMPSDHRCLVFVNQRHTARLLHRVFSHIGGPHLRTGILVGDRKGSDLKVSLREQILTLSKFRSGDLNCLFATSIAEEGLDIPDCNLVVRFDLYKTVIQYIQSRGRARHRNSVFLNMVEAGSYSQHQTLEYVRKAESKMKSFCRTLPEDRLLHGYDDDDEPFNEQNYPYYTDPQTGARLSFGSCLTVLAHFVSSLPRDGEQDTALQPIYVMSSEAGKFICEVVLPDNCPIRSAIGQPARRKAIAKRSAAFQACIMLRKGKYINAELLPIYTKELPKMRNAHLALNSKNSNQYLMRLKPSIWADTRGSSPKVFYLTVLDLTEQPGRPFQPLGLVTSRPLPDFPHFPLFPTKDLVTLATTTSLTTSFELPEYRVNQLTRFTLRVFMDVFAKTYEENVSNMSYWLSPLLPTAKGVTKLSNALGLIDWQPIDDTNAHDEYIWSSEMTNEFLADRYLVDRFDGGRRLFTVAVDPDLKPSDSVPEDTVKGPHMMLDNTILEYSVSLFRKSRANATWNPQQPVVEASKALQRRNLLAGVQEKEHGLRTKAYVCPEPFKISTIPSPVAAMCYMFPAIVFRLEAYLIALEGATSLGINISPSLALEAMTKDSDNSDEHWNTDKVNFRPGMGANYERLEFIGDCFLKMATTIAIFSQYPTATEFEMHCYRMVLLCNKNLFKVAIDKKLYEYIRSTAFSRRLWYPEGLKLLAGKGVNEKGDKVVKHALGDKTIADVSEALIGAAYLHHNDVESWTPGSWDEAVNAVSILVDSSDHSMRKWSDYLPAYIVPSYQTAEASASQRDLAAKLGKEHLYHFKYPKLVRAAFLHPSFPFTWEHVPSYERLEFLGDALLDMASISYLFYKFPNADPQWLTEHKMAMVSNKFLGAVSVKLGFHRHLKTNHATIEGQITEYVAEVEEAEKEGNGALDYWTSVKAPPKSLPDIVESYVGAIFVDSGFDYSHVQHFFDAHIKPFFVDMSIYDTFANNHPTTRLHHVMSINMGCRDYRLMSMPIEEFGAGTSNKDTVVAGVMIHGIVWGEDVGSSSRNVKVRASANCLKLVEGISVAVFREQFGCDCGPAEERNVHNDEHEVDIGTAI